MKNVISNTASFLVILGIAGCAVPDITEDIAKANQAVAAFAEPVDKVFAAREAEALEAQLEALISAGRHIYAPSESCAIVANYHFTQTPCTLEEDFQPSDDLVRYRAVRDILRQIQGYLDALNALATSQSPNEIAGAVTNLYDQIEQLTVVSKDRLPASLAKSLLKRQSSAPLVTQFAAEQAQNVALRRAVRIGDDAIEVGVLTIIAYLREEGLVNDTQRLSELARAERALETARRSNNPQTYRTALKAFKTAVDNVEKERHGTLFSQLRDLRLAHRRMAEALLGPASLNDVRNAVITVNKIVEARAKEENS